MATLALVPRPQTLYSVEEQLQSLLDTAELVEPEQEEQFLADFAQALDGAVAKRDAVGQYLAHCESQISLAAAEIERLTERKRAFEASLERLKGYIVRIIEGFGSDERGKYRTLEGTTVTLSIRKCPVSVEVTDETAVPMRFKTVRVTLSAELFDRLLDSLDCELAGELLEHSKDSDISINKRLVKQALEAHLEIAGVSLVRDKHSLVRR